MRYSRQRAYTIEELISAIREDREIAEIRQIISGIDDINQPDNYGQIALYYAARDNHIEIVRELIVHGANQIRLIIMDRQLYIVLLGIIT